MSKSEEFRPSAVGKFGFLAQGLHVSLSQTEGLLWCLFCLPCLSLNITATFNKLKFRSKVSDYYAESGQAV